MNQGQPNPMHPPQEAKPRPDPLSPTRKDTIAPCEHDPFDGSTPLRRKPAHLRQPVPVTKSETSIKRLKDFLKSSMRAKEQLGEPVDQTLLDAMTPKLPLYQTRHAYEALFTSNNKINIFTPNTYPGIKFFRSCLTLLIQVFHKETTR